MPQDLLDALGRELGAHPLDPRDDARRAAAGAAAHRSGALDRRARSTLPAARTFALTGSASVNPGASDAAIDAALGVPGTVTAEASESLPGLPAVPRGERGRRRSGDRVEHAVRRRRRAVGAVRHAAADHVLAACTCRSSPTAGTPFPRRSSCRSTTRCGELDAPADHGPAGRERDGHGAAALPGDDRAPDPRHDHRRAHRSSRPASRPATRSPRRSGSPSSASPACRSRPRPAELPGACRSDLLTIDGNAVAGARHRLDRGRVAARRALGDAVRSARSESRARRSRSVPGAHVLRTSEGVRTGVQIDRLVLASAAGGGPLAVDGGRVTGLGAAPPPAPTVTVVHNGATRMRVHVTRRRRAVLARARAVAEPGLEGDDREPGRVSGPSQLVDGYANGWLVKPDRARRSTSCSSGHRSGRCGPRSGSRRSPRSRASAIVGWALVRRRGAASAAAPDPVDARVDLEWPVPARGTAAHRGAGASRSRCSPVSLGADRRAVGRDRGRARCSS